MHTRLTVSLKRKKRNTIKAYYCIQYAVILTKKPSIEIQNRQLWHLNKLQWKVVYVNYASYKDSNCSYFYRVKGLSHKGKKKWNPRTKKEIWTFKSWFYVYMELQKTERSIIKLQKNKKILALWSLNKDDFMKIKQYLDHFIVNHKKSFLSICHHISPGWIRLMPNTSPNHWDPRACF